jgi:hypothetical protein
MSHVANSKALPFYFVATWIEKRYFAVFFTEENSKMLISISLCYWHSIGFVFI